MCLILQGPCLTGQDSGTTLPVNSRAKKCGYSRFVRKMRASNNTLGRLLPSCGHRVPSLVALLVIAPIYIPLYKCVAELYREKLHVLPLRESSAFLLLGHKLVELKGGKGASFALDQSISSPPASPAQRSTDSGRANSKGLPLVWHHSFTEKHCGKRCQGKPECKRKHLGDLGFTNSRFTI